MCTPCLPKQLLGPPAAQTPAPEAEPPFLQPDFESQMASALELMRRAEVPRGLLRRSWRDDPLARSVAGGRGALSPPRS